MNISKLKEKNVIATSNGKFDTKKKLNASKKKVSQSVLEKLEQGVTIEQLDEIVGKGMPIFKYKTQITIHGEFPKLKEMITLYGYKHIFQNKNKSIGLRYGAIDEEKRQAIHEKIKPIGFGYRKTSSDNVFRIVKRVIEKDEFEKEVENIKSIYNRIDDNLFYGDKKMYAGKYMGAIYIILDMYIGAIYQKDVEKLVSKIAPKEEVQEIKRKEEQERKEREAHFEAERKKEKKELEKLKAKEQSNIDKLDAKFKRVEGKLDTDSGIFLRVSFHHYVRAEVKYTLIKVSKPKRARKRLVEERSFQSYTELKEYIDNPESAFGLMSYKRKVNILLLGDVSFQIK